jgi:hypothetical protein
MNTATQLLERCKTLLDKADFNDEESYQQSQLLCDIEAYLAKPQIAQEPVGYVERITGRLAYIGDAHREKFKNQYDALYTQPSGSPFVHKVIVHRGCKATLDSGVIEVMPVEREPLSDDEIDAITRSNNNNGYGGHIRPREFARAIEAKLNDK